MQNINQAIPDW